MTVIRLAIEEDIPRLLELYCELVITTSQVELSRSLSPPDDYRRVFADICAASWLKGFASISDCRQAGANRHYQYKGDTAKCIIH